MKIILFQASYQGLTVVSPYVGMASLDGGSNGCIMQELTVVSPYVGMAQKQDGGTNGCISNYTTITRLGASVTHFEALFCPF